MDAPIIIGLIIGGLLHGIVCSVIAGNVLKVKGYSESQRFNWQLAACFFGILGLLGAIGLPDKSADKKRWQERLPKKTPSPALLHPSPQDIEDAITQLEKIKEITQKKQAGLTKDGKTGLTKDGKWIAR